MKKDRKGEVDKAKRKGEERKVQKKMEQKRLGERQKKRDKAKKERKFRRSKITEKRLNSSGEGTMSKMETTGLVPGNQSQSPPKHKPRERSEQRKHPHTPCASADLSSKYENNKTSGPQKLPVKVRPVPPHSRNTSPNQSSNKPSTKSSKSEDGPKEKPANTLSSHLFKALAPLSTACSPSSDNLVCGKEGGQGGVLNAPDLQPVTVMGSLREMGDNLANTPPVLSWQGSPVSDVGEDEEELEKGVICRPVLQPSPTQCFSPPPVDHESVDNSSKEPRESIHASYDDNNRSERCDLFCTTEQADEEEMDTTEENSDSLLDEFCHNKAGLDDVFKSLATFLGGQRVPCRGGPFGGSRANISKGVKCSSSLSFGPERQDFSSKFTASSEPCDQSPIHTTSEKHLKSRSPTDKSEHGIGLVQETQKEADSDIERKQEGNNTETLPQRIESTLLDSSLSAELRLTTTNSNVTSVLTVSTKEEREHSDEAEYKHTDKKTTKQNIKDGRREIKKKTEGIRHKIKVNEIRNMEERDVSSSKPVISRGLFRPLEESKKNQISQENQTSHGKGNQREKMDTKVTLAEKKEEVCKISTAAANIDTKTSNSASVVTISASKVCVAAPARKLPFSLAPVDPLKLKALSLGLCKELKIVLVKVENGGRHTFNISEVEEQRIPLSKISIENTAAEVIRACK